MPRRRPESRRCPAAGGRYPRPAASLRAALQARGTAGRRKEGAGGRSPAASGSRRRAAGFGGRRGHAARTGGAGSVCCPRAGRGSATLSPATVRACLQAAAAPPGCCCCCCQTHFLAPSLCVGRGHPTAAPAPLPTHGCTLHPDCISARLGWICPGVSDTSLPAGLCVPSGTPPRLTLLTLPLGCWPVSVLWKNLSLSDGRPSNLKVMWT
ncbi:uncharacterized protein LOC120506059 isoform X1 [Passer montanus]|uniref:uncharacterized protein LOC120506059 isoform X1 n=1 Tax=Passer montanus TaxID=9160 RepID=UPI0019616809|nr:uncharacterized protein LOC120506059 isoform X1 [Passer montanus]